MNNTSQNLYGCAELTHNMKMYGNGSMSEAINCLNSKIDSLKYQNTCLIVLNVTTTAILVSFAVKYVMKKIIKRKILEYARNDA